MTDSNRIVVRTEMPKRFENVSGAKVGENYNAEILHQLMQKNAARMLVQHRAEMK